MPNVYHPFDTRLEHRAPGAAALAADTVLATINQRAQGRTDYTTVIYVESVEIASNDELYKWVIEVSNDNFTTVDEVAAMRDMGATEVRQSGAPDTVAGDRIEIDWSTEVNGVRYKDWRLKLFVSGTVATGIVAHAYSTIRE